MTATDCRAGRCSCAAIEDRRVGGTTVRQRAQTGYRAPDGQIVWMLQPSNAWVSPGWAKHIEALRTAPKVTLGWIDGWLVYRTHPHEDELRDYAFGRIRWEHNAETTPPLFEVPA
ncbi:hypothetical protein [Mycobacterium sp. 23]|uniref:hypothetical protein n=1 Tax=Mycobacterium sp. 23 TaxID=3400424 RepID=UPI003AAED822